MPTFDTPEPVSAVVELVVGDVRITASDRDRGSVRRPPLGGQRYTGWVR